MTRYLLKACIILLEIVRWFFILIILLSLFGILASYMTNVHAYPHFLYVVNIEKIIYRMVKEAIPTKIMNYDMTRIFTIVLSLIIIEIIRSITNQLKFVTEKQKMVEELSNIKHMHHSSKDQTKVAILENKISETTSFKKDRRKLLREFAKLKTELAQVGRDLTFLSIDVVDSTQMKIGEDPVIVENDFLEYHHYIDNKLKQYNLINASWTPDGVMACFKNLNDAVLAAQDILNNLDYFNNHVKGMKHNFNLRCGINAGHVYYDDDSIPLGQFSDRIIDIAGHMQKNAPVNTILIPRNLIAPLKVNVKFKETNIVVDDLNVLQWTKEK